VNARTPPLYSVKGGGSARDFKNWPDPGGPTAPGPLVQGFSGDLLTDFCASGSEFVGLMATTS